MTEAAGSSDLAEQQFLILSAGATIAQGNNANGLQIADLPKGLYYLEMDGKVEKIIVQ